MSLRPVGRYGDGVFREPVEDGSVFDPGKTRIRRSLFFPYPENERRPENTKNQNEEEFRYENEKRVQSL